MQKMTELLKKLNIAFGKQPDLLVMLCLAFVMLVVALAVNYVVNYSIATFTSDKYVNNWEYVYTNQEQENFMGELETANSRTPMSREKIGSYLHMRTKLKESDTNRTLVIQTDHSPIKITIDGDEVYNNHYGDSEYVGNTYNAVVISPSNDEKLVEVSMRLPFSAEVSASLSLDGGHPAFSMSGGIIFAIVLAIISVAVLAFAFIMRIVKHRKTQLSIMFFLLFVYTATVLTTALSHSSYLLNFPQFYNITIAMTNLCIAVFLFAVMWILKIRTKKMWFYLFVYITLSLLVIPVNMVSLLNLAVCVSCAFGVLIIISLANMNRRLLNRRIQYTKSNYFMLITLAMFYMLGSGMFFSLRYRTSFRYCTLIGAFLFVCFMLATFISRGIFYQNPQETTKTIRSYDNCVKMIAELIKNVLQADNEIEMSKIVADGICDFCRTLSKESENKEIAFSVLLKDMSNYRKIYSTPSCGDINCLAIENRCLDNGHFCLFSETYFDFVMLKNDEPFIIFHFENIRDGLDLFFEGILDTIVSCVNAAVSKFLNSKNFLQAQEDIFVKLALDVETASGNNSDHLENVRFNTKTILETMGYPQTICDTVSKAAMLHDIGKIAIPYEINNKKGLLSEDERKIIKNHTMYGYDILSVFSGEFLGIASIIAKEHHEEYDGSGYRGIAGEQINEYARVVSVADVLDALTSRRSYKEPWSFEAAVDYINEESGKMFDPKVVSALHECLDKIRSRVTEKIR